MRKAREQKIRFDEATVHVREVGEGPPVLLINGIGAHTAMWDTLERTLDGFRILEFDLPGAGKSDVPWKPVSVVRLARLATQVLDKFGVERADVLGYSMGGIVAQQMAADAPERIRRLVLVATSPGFGAAHGDIKAMLNILTPLRYMNPKLYASTIGSLAGGRARHDGRWIAEQGELRMQHAPSMRGYMTQMLSLIGWSSLPRLREIPIPTLVLAGDDDPLTPVANGKLLAHMLPQGRLLVFHGEGHLMVLDAESAAQPAISEFLTAKRLDRSPVWREASHVDEDELERAFASAGWQAQPWAHVSARHRRRWLTSPGRAALPPAGPEGPDGEPARRTA
jgi:pimeloyl-ACP methyl ester carboxylesterase